MKKILIVLMGILLSGVAHAGPFGTSEGDGLDRYPGAESLGDNTYVVYSLPKSHPDFDTFLLTIPGKYGLVKIQALSKTIDNDSAGEKTRALFSKIQKQLESKYGEPEYVFDDIKPDSIWKKTTEWSIALAKDERALRARWKVQNDKDHIIIIGLSAHAKQKGMSTENAVHLFYFYDKMNEYMKEKAAEEAGSL
jgi:hypothetical protein